MLGIFRRLLGRGEEHTAMPQSAAPRLNGAAPRSLAYDPNLVGSLMQDHQDLVQLYQKIGRQAESGRFQDIPALLATFKTRLEGHLIAENVRFYNYVENTLRSDTENFALIRSFRREMNTIARGVVDFVKKYQTADFYAAQVRQGFHEDYKAVGALLAERIEREEHSLYPLYQPE